MSQPRSAEPGSCVPASDPAGLKRAAEPTSAGTTPLLNHQPIHARHPDTRPKTAGRCIHTLRGLLHTHLHRRLAVEFGDQLVRIDSEQDRAHKPGQRRDTSSMFQETIQRSGKPMNHRPSSNQAIRRRNHRSIDQASSDRPISGDEGARVNLVPREANHRVLRRAIRAIESTN